MSFDTLFGVLVCSQLLATTSHEASHLRNILSEIERLGYGVTKTASVLDADMAIRSNSALGCLLLEWGDDSWQREIDAMITGLRSRGHEMPIFVLVRRHRLDEIPLSVLGQVIGYLFLTEDMPDFIAKNLLSHLKLYADSLKTPFFGAMVDYADAGNQVWTCPGHNGGIFYWKTPVGRLFVEHFGEAIFRNDLDNSVVELGDLLTHEGPALRAQQEAARIFGADRTYFVLNGTSTSNQIVLGALVSRGDLVLFDRNNHKSAHHGALINAGGIPVYLPTARNRQGLIGPIDHAALDETSIRERIRANKLIADPQAWQRTKPFRVAIVEQCSYDGTIYNARMIFEKLSPLCEYILFDEAWAGFMKFHPLFHRHFAMGLSELSPDDAGIIATQSTHKQLAGFSQASQIHIKDVHIRGQPRHVNHTRFNESFMLHASTSPFYPLFASLDVGAQMMKGRAGTILWDDTIRLGIELRKKLRALQTDFAATAARIDQAWFFDPFVPDVVDVKRDDGIIVRTRWEDVATDQLASEPAFWQLVPGAAWHGFAGLVPGFAMTDPNKLTLITPGLSRTTGEYEHHGIPAAILAEFLRENRIVPEKNDLNSILFLLTPGLESSKAGTLLSALVRFKTLHDANVPLHQVIPDFLARHPQHDATTGLYDLCHAMHAFYRDHKVADLQRDQFRTEHCPDMAMTPQDAMQCFIRNRIDYLPLDQLEGRIAATLVLVYPPGIGVIVPGERFNERTRPMVDYLRMFEAAGNRFPGFDTEIQGVYRETSNDGTIRLFTYVVQPEAITK